jgi:uncharacterized protein (DUF58 family)
MPRVTWPLRAIPRRPAPATAPLEIDESELARLAQVAGRLLGARPLLTPGHQPARRRAGDGSEFLEHRDYAPGDDPRRIDWRASARTRRTQVRRYRDEASADWHLCVDVSASMGSAGAAKWSMAQRLAIALAYLLLTVGQRVGLIAFASGPVSVLPVGRGRRQLTRLLAQVGGIAPGVGGATSLAAVESHVGPRDPLFVLGDFLREDALCPELARLAHGARELHAIMIGTALDRAPPVSASVEDVETGERIDVRAEPSAPAAEWLALQEKLRRCCRARGIVLSTCDVGESWRDVVLRHLHIAQRPLG